MKFGTALCKVIDLDELGIKVEHFNYKYGKCLKFYHVNSQGAYNCKTKQFTFGNFRQSYNCNKLLDGDVGRGWNEPF